MPKSESELADSQLEQPLTSCRIKESLRKHFANLANDFERRLSEISSELAAIEGPLEVRSTATADLLLSSSTVLCISRTNRSKYNILRLGYLV